MRRLREDPGHLPADRVDPVASRRRATQRHRVHVHREGGGGASRTRIHSILEQEGVDTARAGRDVRRHDARVRPRPAAAARAGDLQVLGADRHHLAALRRPEQPQVRADRLPDQLSPARRACGATSTRSSTCRRRASSARTTVDEDLVPDGVRSVVQRLHEAALRERLLRLHRDDQPGRSVPRGRRGRRRERGQVQRSHPRRHPLRRGRRVPGRQPAAGAPRPGPDAVRREPLRRRRRRPDDLPVARQRGLEHRHVRRPLRRRPAGHARRQLPLERGRRRGGPVDRGADPRRRSPAEGDGAGGHQSWTRGDLLARDFADEDEEAAWICDRIEAMRGLAFNDTADSRAARPVVVGLRRAVPVGREGRRTRSSQRCAGATSRTSSRA